MRFPFPKTIALVASALVPLAAQADFDLAVKVDCRPAQKVLVIRFLKSWNGGDLQGGLNPKDLIKYYENDAGQVLAYRSEQVRTCALQGEVYTILIRPNTAPRWDPVGYCATRVGADVRVLKGGRQVAQDGNDACIATGKVPIQLTLRPGKPVVYQRVPAVDFNDY